MDDHPTDGIALGGDGHPLRDSIDGMVNVLKSFRMFPLFQHLGFFRF
jgi:hypothetical protein